MSRNCSNRGFAAIEALLIIVIIGLISTAGWFVHNNQKSDPVTAKSSAQTSSQPKPSATKTNPTTATKQTTNPSTTAFVNVIQEDGSIIQMTPEQFGKTDDQIAMLNMLHNTCTGADKNVTVNHSIDAAFKQDGNYAAMNTTPCDPVVSSINQLQGSGAGHYMHKNSTGLWVLDLATQMGPDCAKIDGLGYPNTIISQCVDYTTNPSTARAPR